MAEHPSALMRRAAARLLELHNAATPPPWRVSFIDGVAPVIDGRGAGDHLVATMYGCLNPAHERLRQADAGLIVILRNSAEALAGWLAEAARRAERDATPVGPSTWCRNCGGIYGHNCACWDGALSTARAILGELP